MKKLFFLPCFFFLMMLQINSHAQIFHEDFEIPDSVTYSGSSNFSQNSRIFTSPNFCDSASIQNAGDVTIMTTMPFSTIGMDSVILYFNHIAKVEFFDACIIECSVDGGFTWQQLIDSDGNPGGNDNCDYYGISLFKLHGSKFQEASYGTWQPGVATTPEFTWWKREIFDVSQLLSNITSAQIRFVLIDQNNNGGSGRAGWFIDDIVVADTLATYLFTFQNRIKGKMYVDMNSNLVQDGIEPPVENRIIRQQSSFYSDFTNSIGAYQINTMTVGTASVQPEPTIVTHPYFNLVPTTNTATFTALGQLDTLNDFALQPVIAANDLHIQMFDLNNCNTTSPSADYWLDAYNSGSTVLNPIIILYPSNLLSFDNASILPSSVTSDSIVWSIGPLYPFQHQTILVQMIKPVGLQLNTAILSSVKIEPVSGDANDLNNFDYDLTLISSSFDPNIIQVDTSTLTPADITKSTPLEYTIYFQNTGNDTASYVRVDNLISTKLDIGTFELLANSHNMQIEYNYLADPRLISFTFNNINLPDSTTNESESHGFICYRIKPNSNLVIGDSILNNAAIYFDFNSPVITNTVVTEIVDPTAIGEMTLQNKWNVYPNPVNSELNINFEILKEENVIIEIFNLYGQKINVLFDEKMTTGLHQHKFNIESLSNGVYLIQFVVGDSRQVRKFVKVD